MAAVTPVEVGPEGCDEWEDGMRGMSCIRNRTTGEVLAERVVRCDRFLSRGRGLMFRRPLREDEVYLFVLGRESIVDAAIHMFFVFFPIAVIWLDARKRVVDMVLARPWRPYYAPRRPARYYVEGHCSLMDKVRVGEELDFGEGGGPGVTLPEHFFL